MSDYFQPDCDSHTQSNPLARLLPSTPSNLKNNTQPRILRLPARQVFSKHDAKEESFDSSSTSEEPGSVGDEDWVDDDQSTGSEDIIEISGRHVSPERRLFEEALAIQMAKEAKFLTSGPTPIATPSPPSLLKKFVALFQDIKVEVKAKMPLTRPALTYRDSYDIPAPEHPGPPVTFSLAFPQNGPAKLRRIFGRGGKWELEL